MRRIEPKMEESRFGCYYCFKTLDPQDKSEVLRMFAKCSNCNTLYHESCLRQSKKCLHCGSTKAQHINIDPPRSFHEITKPQMLPVKPSGLGYSMVGKEFAVPEFVYKHIFPVIFLIWKKTPPLIRKITNKYIIPAYNEYILPRVEKLRNRIQG